MSLRRNVLIAVLLLTSSPHLGGNPAHAGLGDCGQPVNDVPNPLASDALEVLRAAVQLVECDLCVCDVDSSGQIFSGDALLVLQEAVSLEGRLDCVSCAVSAVIGAEGGTISLDDGEATLTVPPGAVDAPTEFSFGGLAPALLEAPLDAIGAEDAYFVSPVGLTFSPPLIINATVDPEPSADSARGPEPTLASYTPVAAAASSGEEEPRIWGLDNMKFNIDPLAETMTFRGTIPVSGNVATYRLRGRDLHEAFNLNADFIKVQEFDTPVERRINVFCGDGLTVNGTIGISDSPSDPSIKGDNAADLSLSGVCFDEKKFTNTCTNPGAQPKWGAAFSIPTSVLEQLLGKRLAVPVEAFFGTGMTAEITYPVECEGLPELSTVSLGLNISGVEGISLLGVPYAGITGEGECETDRLFVVAGSNGGEVFIDQDNGTGKVTRKVNMRDSYNSAGRVEAIGMIDPRLSFRGAERIGADVYFEVSNSGWTLVDYEPEFGEFNGFATVGGGSANHTDVRAYANDSTSGGALFVDFQDNEVESIEFREPDGFSPVSISRQISPTALAAAAGNVISVYPQESEGLVVGVTVGNETDTPGDIFTFTGSNTNAPVTIVGQAGISPRRIRCTNLADGGACMVTNFGDGTINSFTVGSDGTLGSISTSDVASDPVGGDIIATSSSARGPSTAYLVITTGFEDNTFVVTSLDGSAAPLTTRTYDAPIDCVNPGHAAWIDQTKFIATCNGSDSVVIATLP